MTDPQLQQQESSSPVLNQSPSLEQQASAAQMPTENATEDVKLNKMPMSPSQSEVITRYASESDLKQEEPKGTILGATANILKSGVGTGILFLPSVFQQCGIALSIVFMVVCSFVCYFCWSLIGKIIRFQESTDPANPTNKNLTLEETGGKLYGEYFKMFLQVCTYIYAYSTCFGYCIYIYQAVEDTIPNNMVTMAIMLAIYLPFSMYKNIDKLSIFTYIALGATIFALLVIIGKSCYVINTTTVDFSALNQWAFDQLPLNFGVFSFAYDVNGVYTEVHASLKDKTKFDRVLKYYLIIFTLLGIFVGTMGYIAFGANTESVIFVNIGSMDGLGTALSFLYSLAELSSILLYIFTVVRFFDRTITKYIFKSTNKCQDFVSNVAVRAIIFFSFSFLALYVTQINATFNILGCIFCTILTYLCPIILYRRCRKNQDAILQKVAAVDVENDIPKPQPKISFLSTHYMIYVISFLCAIFGLLGGISGLISTIYSLQSS